MTVPKFSINGWGISIQVGDEAEHRLIPSPTASQTRPKRSYVYGHFDEHGTPFYVGRGKGKRAWSDERHDLWHRYVANHLGGKYFVIILVDDLDEEESADLEEEWMEQESQTLINWGNPGRETDLPEVERYWRLRNENKKLLESCKGIENSQLEKAIEGYIKALEVLADYASIQPVRGLVGRLLDEERAERGINGDLQILDRLTLCLVRAGRGQEAATLATDYFARYRADELLARSASIRKRVAKAILCGSAKL